MKRRSGPSAVAVLLLAASAGGNLAAQEAIAVERCRSVLAELDAAFTRGDANGYLRAFAPEQPFLHEVHARQIRQRLAAEARLARGSEIVGSPRRLGDHTVATVTYTTRAAERPTAPPLVEHGLLVLREQGGAVVPTLAIEVPATTAQCAEDRFECPACNYRIGGAPGWLFAPVATSRSGAVEAGVFVRLGADIGLEVTVRAGASPVPARTALQSLLGELRERLAGERTGPATPGPIEDWAPPGLDGRTPDAFSAARAAIDLANGQRLAVFVTALGALQHVLLLRGDRRQLERHRAACDELLGSYALMVEDADLAAQQARSLSMHTGGALDRLGSYENRRHDVRIDALVGWRAELRAAGTAFQTVWNCPEEQGRLWLTGYLPPPGLLRWTPGHVDTWLERLGPRAGLRLPARLDSGFSAPDATGQCERRLEFDRDGDAPRLLRILLRDDLLIVADGWSDLHPEEVRRVIGTLRRR